MKKERIRISKTTFLTSVFCAIMACLTFSLPFAYAPAIAGYTPVKIAVKEQPRSYSILFVGDIMLDRDVRFVTEKSGDWRWPFLRIGSLTNSADITVANLEGPISDRGKKQSSMYAFRFDPRSVQGLKYAGFDLVSLANNHMWDYGADALKDTLAYLSSASIAYSGAGSNYQSAHDATILEIGDGTKIAFLSYTDIIVPEARTFASGVGVTFFDELQMQKDIATAKERADLVVAMFHMGDEYKPFHNQKQDKIFKKAVDSGADLVIGHHPHVIQDDVLYGQAQIFYSLGNFVFDQNFSKETMEGLAVKVNIYDKKITSSEKIKFNISPSHQPYLP